MYKLWYDGADGWVYKRIKIMVQDLSPMVLAYHACLLKYYKELELYLFEVKNVLKDGFGIATDCREMSGDTQESQMNPIIPYKQ